MYWQPCDASQAGISAIGLATPLNDVSGPPARAAGGPLPLLHVAEGLDFGELCIGKRTRGVALLHLGTLTLMPDTVNYLGVRQRGDITHWGEVRDRRDDPAHDLA